MNTDFITPIIVPLPSLENDAYDRLLHHEDAPSSYSARTDAGFAYDEALDEN